MAEAESVLRASALTLGYGGPTVLENVDLEVRAGEFWFLVGPNGSGKTTLLRAILGLLAPLSGELWVHPGYAGGAGTAFVPQRSQFNDTLPTSVREFVLLGLAGLRPGRAAEAARLEHALEQVGLRGMERRDYRSLSGGQRQRALVARALVRQPRLLILDEPTTGLDWSATAALMRFLVRLRHEEALTLLFVTHDLHSALAHATHVALLHDRRVETGAPAELLTAERLRRSYGIPIDLAPSGLSLREDGA
jgi:ABC-type Mn2+/Zn2+ transport system ATPase subunit